MPNSQRRESLICTGGPLSGIRLSVSPGLQWFAITTDDVSLPPRDQSSIVLNLENIEGIVDSSHDRDCRDFDSSVAIYVRRQFVSGESGLAEVFSYLPGDSPNKRDAN